MKSRYNLINNTLGWLCFIVAAVSYLLTLEPTASFWDCPEYISQGYKLEVGHPPGNPIWIMMARVAANFAGGDISKVAIMVNASSAIFSALTILLLFWTITHLVKRLVVRDDADDISLPRMLIIMGSGLCGALVYAWSDTFWFSAVEAEVYAFSSFCTALVFWLILKWETRADQPHSDRYLVLLAYVIGISIAVHLLNLLCIPACVLVVYYRKWKNCTAKGSIIALLVSFVIVALILFGLVPGFIEVSQSFELFFVNTLGWSYNMGVLVYAILTIAAFVWCISQMYAQRNPAMMKVSFFVAILLSGIPFIGSSWWAPVLILGALAAYLFFVPKLPVRVLTLVTLSCFVIFIGYTSYALILIRSTANTPMNQNTPDNVFALASYLNREQYGDTPLLYGRTPYSGILYRVEGQTPKPIVKWGEKLYGKAVKESDEEPDRYVNYGEKKDYVMTPELNMVFPRIHSPQHIAAYKDWIDFTGTPVEATIYVDSDGQPLRSETKYKPTVAENLNFFLTYQLNHMYWRYFMWNFAGRQNDIQGNGEVTHGNWISGIPFIDNMRLGDQSLLPDDLGAGNKGHNVFFMLPLLLGIIGLLWQAFHSQRGIEQFWVVFFLFFMTGIAIVLYLNQTPSQPRERDYAFAGSFYAYAIWVGMGVAGIWQFAMWLLTRTKRVSKISDSAKNDDKAIDAAIDANPKCLTVACLAVLIGLLVPLQVVSQTWDDHDRSGRYAARDFGANYLNSLDENAIIFTNGDNDTFPLWYNQEVEGERTDVRVVNLSYLQTDWYINQMKHPTYNAAPIDMLAQPKDYAFDRLQFVYFINADTTRTDALTSLAMAYDKNSDKNEYGLPTMTRPSMYIPLDREALVKSGRLTPEEAQNAQPYISVDFLSDPYTANDMGASMSKLASLDMIATSAKNGWNRPIYFAQTVPSDYYLGLSPYMRSTGMAYEVSGLLSPTGRPGVDTDKMYRNVTERFRWGGLDAPDSQKLYLDETVRRMVTSTRASMLDLARALISEGLQATDSIAGTPGEKAEAYAKDRYAKARVILDLITEKLPVRAMPYGIQTGLEVGQLYDYLAEVTSDKSLNAKARDIIKQELDNYTQYILYFQSLNPWQYSTLPNNDRWIDQVYYLDLLQEYSTMGGDAEAYMVEAAKKGVDFDRQARFMDKQRK